VVNARNPVTVTYSRWGTDAELLLIVPEGIGFDSECGIFPTPEPTWLLECHDVGADEHRTLRLDKVQGFSSMPCPSEELLGHRIKDLQRQVAQLQDAQRVVKRMALEAQGSSGEPLDPRHVANLMHAGTTQSEVYVAELGEMRVILGTLLDTQDKVTHYVYEHGSITHEELSRIMARQYDRKRTEEGRVVLERVGRLVAAVLGGVPYDPVEAQADVDALISGRIR
jgi:hypothetical protein